MKFFHSRCKQAVLPVNQAQYPLFCGENDGERLDLIGIGAEGGGLCSYRDPMILNYHLVAQRIVTLQHRGGDQAGLLIHGRNKLLQAGMLAQIDEAGISALPQINGLLLCQGMVLIDQQDHIVFIEDRAGKVLRLKVVDPSNVHVNFSAAQKLAVVAVL